MSGFHCVPQSCFWMSGMRGFHLDPNPVFSMTGMRGLRALQNSNSDRKWPWNSTFYFDCLQFLYCSMMALFSNLSMILGIRFCTDCVHYYSVMYPRSYSWVKVIPCLSSFVPCSCYPSLGLVNCRALPFFSSFWSSTLVFT